jgi:prepilin-type N-terminal cleavage/methylation domain-containing protein
VKFCRKAEGFTLVEMMIAMVIMGIVTAAVYTTLVSTQRQAYTQEDVIEVQQNLRAGLDFMAKDIRMAEFLTPSDQTALVNAPSQMLVDSNSDGDYEDTDERPLLSFVSVTSMRSYGRIETASASGTNLAIDLALSSMQKFASGDKVRVVRSTSLNTVTSIFSVDSVSGSQVVLSGGASSAGDIQDGDLLVMLPPGAADGDFPLQIDYQLIDSSSGDPNMNELQRRVVDMDGNVIEGFQLIASNISGLDLTYLDDGGNGTSTLDDIVAVQITITGQTDATETGRDNYSGVKTRTLSTTVKIHNGVVL